MKTLKSKIRLFVFLLLITGSQNTFATHFTVPGGFDVWAGTYMNNMDVTWTIDLEANKPVLFDVYVDIEDGYDFVYFYAIDNFDNEVLVKTMTGLEGYQIFSTLIPTGKAKVVFISNGEYCSDYGYEGFDCYFDFDNNPDLYEGTYTGGNSIMMGKTGIGTLTPSKKLEIWDGNSGRFTFSAANCTSGYETAHTIDNTGYKINVVSYYRDFRVAVSNVDKFKILRNDNYALGTGALNSTIYGYNNIALGANSLNKTYGNENLGIGVNSLYSNTTASYNIGLGSYSLYALSSGSYNTALGYNSGRYIANGTNNSTSTYSVFIGPNSKAKANGQTNQIVIGYNAIGNGSNTVTLGNDNIVNTVLKGNVGIGYTNPQYLLDVKGTIHAMEVKIEASTSFPDYVFADDYELMSLSDLNHFISTNRHLPGIPSAGEAQENGVNVGEMQEKLLKKIEELTLYIIDQQKEIDELKKSLGK